MPLKRLINPTSDPGIFLYIDKNIKWLISRAFLGSSSETENSPEPKGVRSHRDSQSPCPVDPRPREGHIEALEQKIAEQGPVAQRVDPHLVSLAIDDLIALRRLAVHNHASTKDKPWYANIGTKGRLVDERLNTLAPLYNQISNTLSNAIGDALEVATFQALRAAKAKSRRYHFEGHFFLNRPKKDGRFQRRKPPMTIDDFTTTKEPDFIQYGHEAGPLCIECKNYREWLYPTKPYIKHHIIRCADLNCVPVFVVGKIHYSTLTNFFEPAGIIAHKSYYPYFPSDQAAIATRAKHKRSLGFTDILASEEPHQRTVRFFSTTLPKISDYLAERWEHNKEALLAYANGEIHLAQLYNAIGSRAAGKWVEPDDEERPEDDDYFPEDF